jgi:hypothetical protein
MGSSRIWLFPKRKAPKLAGGAESGVTLVRGRRYVSALVQRDSAKQTAPGRRGPEAVRVFLDNSVVSKGGEVNAKVHLLAYWLSLNSKSTRSHMGSRPSRDLLRSPNSVRDASDRDDSRNSSGRSNRHRDDRHGSRDDRHDGHAHGPPMRQPENTPPRQAPQRLLDR